MNKNKVHLNKRKWLSKTSDMYELSTVHTSIESNVWASDKEVVEGTFTINDGTRSVYFSCMLDSEKEAKDTKYKLDTLIDTLTEYRDTLGKAYQDTFE